MHESSLYQRNCFLTLTYRKDALPVDGTLVLTHFQKYMKKLRKRISPVKVRNVYCGEYGDKKGRPHFHAIVFNYDYPDKVYKEKTDRGDDLFTSRLADKDWGHGNVIIGAVTFESAAYLARYATKKITGKWLKEGKHHYGERVDSNGEIHLIKCPEFFHMSRRPGLGAAWFKKFRGDVFPNDGVISRGRRISVPSFYDDLLERSTDVPDAITYGIVMRNRVPYWADYNAAIKRIRENSPKRLAVREICQKASMFLLPRGLEDGEN